MKKTGFKSYFNKFIVLSCVFLFQTSGFSQHLDTLFIGKYESQQDSGIIFDKKINRKISNIFYEVFICGADTIGLQLGKMTMKSGTRIRIYDGRWHKAKILIEIDSANSAEWQDSMFKFAGYGFQVSIEGAKNLLDSIFFLKWKTISKKKLRPFNPAITSDKGKFIANGVSVKFEANWDNQGWEEFYYDIDGVPIVYYGPRFDYTFTTDGTYEITGYVRGCGDSQSASLTVVVYTPTQPVDIRIKAEYADTSGSGYQVVRLTAESFTANWAKWNIIPSDYTILSGFLESYHAGSHQLVVKLKKDTCYSFTIESKNTVSGLSSIAKDTVKNFYCKKRLQFSTLSFRRYYPVMCYFDRDSNGVYNLKTDVILRNSSVSLGKGRLATTGNDGILNLKYDTAVVVKPLLDSRFWTLSRNQPESIWLDTIRPLAINMFGFKSVKSGIDMLDIQSSGVFNSFVVNGFKTTLFFSISNLGNVNHDNVWVEVETNDTVEKPQFIYGDKAIKFADGNKFGFSISAAPYSNTIIAFEFRHVPTSQLFFNGRISAFGKGKTKDNDSSNNRHQFKLSIVRACDPNDIAVSPEKVLKKPSESLKYHVRFQNTGDYYATRVVVIDTISPKLDINSFRLLSTSHDGFASINGRVISFIFNDIYLPDSGTDFDGSQGYITFEIKPDSGIKPYDTIKNFVDIYFDYEKPVRTNTAVFYWESPPELLLLGKEKINLTSCDTFMETGCTATDLIDGDLTKKIIITGSLVNGKAGIYKLRYFAVNSHQDTGWAERVIQISDNVRPHILFRGKYITNEMTVKWPINVPFVDSVYAHDSCSGNVGLSIFPGWNGNVNPSVRAVYPMMYIASDISGNTAYENGYIINYKVDDYEAPEIVWNGNDTICHQIGKAFVVPAVQLSDNYYPVNKLQLTVQHKVNANAAGLYSINYSASDPSGNNSIRTIFVKVADCSPISSVATRSKNQVIAFPNPVSEVLQLKGLPENENPLLQLCNASGQMIMEKRIMSTQGMAEISLSNIPAGLYQLQIQFTQGNQVIPVTVMK